MLTLELLYIFIFLCVITVIVSSLYFEQKTKIIAAPTLPWVQREFIQAIEKHSSSEHPYKIVELGSGWGTLLFPILKHFPQTTITGYELAFFPYWCSIARRSLAKNKHSILIYKKDFFLENLSKFSIVICYLSHFHMKELKEKFEKELKPNTLVISNAFPIPDWEPIETRTIKALVSIPLYIYKVKAKN